MPVIIGLFGILSLTSCGVATELRGQEFERSLRAVEGVTDIELRSSTGGFPSVTSYSVDVFVDPNLTDEQSSELMDRFCGGRLSGQAAILAEPAAGGWILWDDRFDDYCEAQDRIDLFRELSSEMSDTTVEDGTSLALSWQGSLDGPEHALPQLTVGARDRVSLMESVTVLARFTGSHGVELSAGVRDENNGLRGAKLLTLAPGVTSSPELMETLKAALELEYEAILVSGSAITVLVPRTELLDESESLGVVSFGKDRAILVTLDIPVPPVPEKEEAFRAFAADLLDLPKVVGLDLCTYECGLIRVIRVQDMAELEPLLSVLAQGSANDHEVLIHAEGAANGFSIHLDTEFDRVLAAEVYSLVQPAVGDLGEHANIVLSLEATSEGTEVSLRAFLRSDRPAEEYESVRSMLAQFVETEPFTHISISQDGRAAEALLEPAYD